MKQKTLDPLTQKYFEWKIGRLTAAEREALSGESTSESVTDPVIIRRDKTAEKGRVRRIKVKVMKLLNSQVTDWSELVGP